MSARAGSVGRRRLEVAEPAVEARKRDGIEAACDAVADPVGEIHRCPAEYGRRESVFMNEIRAMVRNGV